MITSNTLWAVAGAVVILANGQGARAAKPWRVVDHRSVAESCLFWLLCLMGCCVDSEAASERVVKLLEAWNKPDSPGMAWTVVSNGVVLERGAFGLATGPSCRTIRA